jgi:hypothetical protein
MAYPSSSSLWGLVWLVIHCAAGGLAFEDRPTRRSGEGLEHVVGRHFHCGIITKWLLIVKPDEKTGLRISPSSLSRDLLAANSIAVNISLPTPTARLLIQNAGFL